MKTKLIILLIGIAFVGCKTTPSIMFGDWYIVGFENIKGEGIEMLQYGDTLNLISKKEGYDKSNQWFFTKISRDKIVGYERLTSAARDYKVVLLVDKITQDSLELIYISHEGYKAYYQRCK